MPRLSLGNFSLELEPNWSLSTAIFIGPVSEMPEVNPTLGVESQTAFRQNIVAVLEPVDAGETASSYLDKQTGQLATAGISRRDIVEPKTVKLANGLEGVITEQVAFAPTGASVRQMQLICIKDNFAYLLVASQLEGDAFENSQQEFEKILMSFS